LVGFGQHFLFRFGVEGLDVLRLPVGSDEPRRYKDQEALLCAFADLALEEAPHERDISQHRDLVIDFLGVFTNKAAQDSRLAIQNLEVGHHGAEVEDGLINDAGCDDRSFL